MVRIGGVKPEPSGEGDEPKESRVRSRSRDLREDLLASRYADTGENASDTEYTGPSRVNSSRERERSNEVLQEQCLERMAELRGYMDEAEASGLPLESIMDRSKNPRGQIPFNSLDLAEKRLSALVDYKVPKSTGARRANPFVLADAAPEVRSLPEKLEHDWNRYKLYLSLKLVGSAGIDSPQCKFLAELAAEAIKRRIDFSWKNEDHNYDKPDIYTDSPEILSEIIQQLYEKYPKDMWYNVPRTFQAQVGSIPVEHIGLVQEPSKGFRDDSHSGRMLQLARIIKPFGRSITLDQYSEACERVGVRPEAPWLLTDGAKEEFLQTMKDRHSRRTTI